MNEIQQKKTKASELRKKESYEEAIELYSDLWSNYRNSCNEWDGWGYALCLKKLGRIEDALSICREVYQINPKFDFSNNLYAWCIYESVINKELESIRDNEKSFLKAANAIIGLTRQSDSSPYVRTVFKVLDYYVKTKQKFPVIEINFWLDKLNPKLLSSECYRLRNDKGNTIEMLSDIEKWYTLKTKVLHKQNQFKECLEVCKEALSKINKFHFNNDIWIRRRIALSKAGSGLEKEAIIDLEELLVIKKEWFIQHEIARLCYMTGKYDDALRYCIDSVLNYGEIEKKYKLILLLAEILILRNEDNLASKHVQLVIHICQKNDWKIPAKGKTLLHKLKIDESSISPYKILHNDLLTYWNSLKYGESPPIKGNVFKILKHGKSGFISADDGKSYFFRTKNYTGERNQIKVGLKVSFFLIESFDKMKNQPSFEAVNICKLDKN